MSFYEAKNPADITVEELYPFVKKYLPDIKQKDIQFFYHGTYNVFELKKKYILRVSDRDFRNAHGCEMLQRESYVLDFLSYRIETPIPKIIHLNESSNLPFSIHEKIPGKSLSYFVKKLSKKKKIDVAIEIAQFLSKLHSEELKEDFIDRFPKERKIIENEFSKHFKMNWVSRYIEARIFAYQYLNDEQKMWLTNLFEEFLKNNDNFTFSPRIAHNDFDTSNILIDPSKKKITGIIDFEDCRIGDPAADLLFFDEGLEFMEALLDNYQFANQKSLQSRMKFYYSRTCTPYLVWGTTHDRPGMIDDGLHRIRKNMKMFP
ncbi:MAG: phosphotransferase family protein [Candidatus Heimdallarchaeota archaeon]